MGPQGVARCILEVAMNYASVTGRKQNRQGEAIDWQGYVDECSLLFQCSIQFTEDQHIVGNIAKAMESIGHTEIASVTDGEPFIAQLQVEVRPRRHPLATYFVIPWRTTLKATEWQTGPWAT